MKVYFPDHRTLEVTQGEYEIAKAIYGDRLVLMGDYDIDPRTPYISKRTFERKREPFQKLEVIPLPPTSKWGNRLMVVGGGIFFGLSLLFMWGTVCL